MSKVKIQGNASGTGVVTLTAPNTNTDRTITLPDEDITLGGGVDGIVSTANATAITIDSSENVGIGVVPKSFHSSRDVLQIGVCGAIQASTSISQFYAGANSYTDTAGVDKYIITDEASRHYQTGGTHNFQVAPSGTADTAITWTDAMTIKNDGDWELGTFSSTGATSGKYVDAGTNAFTFRSSANTTNAKSHFAFYNTNGLVGTIDTSGSATSYSTSSDYRLKENVVPMTGSIDRLKALKPSKFNFIADPLNTVDGFLAHEAQEVVPECAHGVKDGMKDEEYEVTPAVMDGETVVTEAVMGTRSVPDYQGIDQSKLVPLLVASLQEAIARIEQLENA